MVGPLVELKDKAKLTKVNKLQVGNDTVDPTKTPKVKGQSRHKSTKKINPQQGEDDSKMLKSYHRGKKSCRTPEDSISSQPTKPFDAIKMAPKIS